MKRGFLLVLGAGFLLFLGTARGESFDSFRGIKWGEARESISGLLQGPENGNVKVFTREETKRVGDIEVESIYYFFYKGRFGAARISFQGSRNASLLKEALQKKYGSIREPESSSGTLVWELADLRVLFHYAEIEQNGRVDYFFRPVVQQREEDNAKVEQQEARKRIDDL